MKFDKVDLIFYIFVIALLLVLAAVSYGQTSSGGAYTMTKTVVAGGGSGDLQQDQMKAGSTVGQTVAGKQSSGGNFTIYTGFWTPDNFAPTAATTTVGGYVKTAYGAGIRNVIVTVIFPSGETRTTVTGTFGYYIFKDIPTGEIYVFNISAKRFRFVSSTLIRTITDETRDINFTAEPD